MAATVLRSPSCGHRPERRGADHPSHPAANTGMPGGDHRGSPRIHPARPSLSARSLMPRRRARTTSAWPPVPITTIRYPVPKTPGKSASVIAPTRAPLPVGVTRKRRAYRAKRCAPSSRRSCGGSAAATREADEGGTNRQPLARLLSVSCPDDRCIQAPPCASAHGPDDDRLQRGPDARRSRGDVDPVLVDARQRSVHLVAFSPSRSTLRGPACRGAGARPAAPSRARARTAEAQPFVEPMRRHWSAASTGRRGRACARESGGAAPRPASHRCSARGPTDRRSATLTSALVRSGDVVAAVTRYTAPSTGRLRR
jgi:hypothetical protein